ncbi:hypothetical protein HMI54_007043 [Coelomomyces lativittatus]|nr:hypothetical protein HMI55_003494 [Coelomomyces lativittatus]KAJ1501925.1 hypothetical protein HMI56_002966 [Coelomomyces lativittatus]KAJ1504398.1 hypothetical protein HMI54_007043 [Coelomomyces lativittatus]
MVLFDNWQGEQYTEQPYGREGSSSSGKSSTLNYVGIAAVLISIIMGIVVVAFIPRQLYEANVNINYLLALFPFYQQSSVTSSSNFNKWDPNYVNYVDQLTIRALLIINIVGICLYALAGLISMGLFFKNSMNLIFSLVLTLFGLISIAVSVSLVVLSPVKIAVPIFYTASVVLAILISWAVVKNN